MGCQPGEILRRARLRHGLSQRRLAVRAGTSQDAVSRIERGVEAPTIDRLQELMLAMGEKLELEVSPLEHALDGDEIAAATALSARDRLYESASWNLAATQLELAAENARRVGDPATRRRRK